MMKHRMKKSYTHMLYFPSLSARETTVACSCNISPYSTLTLVINVQARKKGAADAMIGVIIGTCPFIVAVLSPLLGYLVGSLLIMDQGVNYVFHSGCSFHGLEYQHTSWEDSC